MGLPGSGAGSFIFLQKKVAENPATTPPAHYNQSMKICNNRNTLGGLINARLADIGASNIPATARELIEGDVWPMVASLVQRQVTAPKVGRAVARALAYGAEIN